MSLEVLKVWLSFVVIAMGRRDRQNARNSHPSKQRI
jgi:hypothetical protein